MARSVFSVDTSTITVSADAGTVYVSCELGNLLVAVPACPETGELGPPAMDGCASLSQNQRSR